MRGIFILALVTLMTLLNQNCSPLRSTLRIAESGSGTFSSENFEKACTAQQYNTGSLYTGLRRLSRVEIANSLRDLTGLDSDILSALVSDPTIGNFDNNAAALTQTVDAMFIEKIYNSADALLGRAFQNNSSRAKILICTQTTSACASTVLKAFIRKSYHRQITDQDVTPLAQVYSGRITLGETHDEALKAALLTALISADFLYRGSAPATGERSVSEHELAHRLSYFIWGSIPDEQLLSLADAGTLKSNLRAQVTRLLQSASAKYLISGFASQWLSLARMQNRVTDDAEYPEFTAELKADMLMETQLLLENTILKDGKISDLVGANFSYLNARLASYYGISGISYTDFRKTDLSSTERRGLISHASILTMYSPLEDTSIVKRGHMISDRILCSDVPPTPPDIDLSSPAGVVTHRDQMNYRLGKAACAGCHSNMDPYGFILENFDPFGKYRTKMPDGSPVDSSVTMSSGVSYFQPKTFFTDLSNDNRFKYCVANHLISFAAGKLLVGSEKCRSRGITDSLDLGTAKFSDLIYNLVTSSIIQKEGAPQ
jgi:hypothetical protein